MEPRPKLVLVTGGTGYVGARIIDELLKDGYNVRATARPHKVDTLKKPYPNANGKLEAAWTAVIHVACPVYHPGVTSEEIYNAANEGTQKLLDAVTDPKSSVKRFVLTGSIGSVLQPFSSLLSAYSEIEAIDPKKHIPSYAYIASKITSEKLPQIEFTTILPSTVCGWFLEDYPVPKTIPELNANKFLYGLIPPTTEFPSFPVYPLRDVVHNLDVVRAHVRALTAPAPPNGERRRFIVSGGPMLWVEAIEFLQEPETIVKFKANLAERGLPEAIVSEVMPHLMAWEETHKEALHPEPS
ncbi:hypothetical protein B0H14DRAFT_2984172 [Mycena olivaceomarginata]|nr:hypothetical protein B0H14DRAFT_2984172 [Mycena olivaceomarginata]